ncbi:MAG: PEP-CTERM sorting domain-containing protein [Microcystis sp. M061S2]|nr:PEP-CTERM sorting domain-containing protein [Microcystis sp. M061S2]
MNRFGLGYGDMALHFGVNAPASQIGGLGYFPGGTPFTSGVLSSVVLPPGGGFTVVDTQFSIPFSLDVDQPASLYMGIGDNGIGGPQGGSIQVIFDFSDNIYFVGSILGFTPDQGFALTSVTLADGTPLENAGLKFEFILENTVLTAGASAFDDRGAGLAIDSVVATQDPSNIAAVFIFPGTATAKLEGGIDGFNPNTNALADLDVNVEPDPFVFDLAFATVSGANNIKLTRISQPTSTPEPSTILGLGVLGFGAFCQRKLSQGKKSKQDN